MHSALPTACLSMLLLNGCSHLPVNDDHGLPSLQDHQPHIIVQVPGDYDADERRDHPYYVVCDSKGCLAPTPKTRIESTRIDTVIVPHETRATSTPTTDSLADLTQHEKRTRPSPSYQRRTSSVLEQYRVHFAYASHRVTEKFRSLLNEFVTRFGGKQRRVPDIRVTGYTDNVTVPNPTVGNEWLALERATSVKSELVALGYPERRILLEAKFLCCYLDTNKTEAGRQNNRRAEISLIETME